MSDGPTDRERLAGGRPPVGGEEGGIYSYFNDTIEGPRAPAV
jgi:hypothetical protein